MNAPPERLFRALREIAVALFASQTPPGGDAPDAEAALDELMRELAAFLAAAGNTPTWALRSATFAVQVSPLFLLGTPRRFSSLDPPARARCLDRIEATPFRYPWWVVKLYLAMLWFEQPEWTPR